MRQLSFPSLLAIGLTIAFLGVLLSSNIQATQAYSSRNVESLRGVQRHIVFCPDPGSEANYLLSISAISPKDIWAVGVYYVGGQGNYGHTLTEHWDGKKWKVVNSPDPAVPAYISVALRGVAAIASDNVWAVGSFQPSGGNLKTLIEHWDGKDWSIVSSPNASASRGSELRAITAISPSNIWAVGGSWGEPSYGQTLVEHWDGRQWSIVRSPNITGGTAENNQLYAISVGSSTDIWTVGYYQYKGAGTSKALILHWDGNSWTNSPIPDAELESFSSLNGVVTLSDGEAWAVGEDSSDAPNQAIQVKTLVLHWDGRQWSRVQSPNLGVRNSLSAIAARSPSDIWAVGNSNYRTTILLHWDGKAWDSAVRPKTRPSWNDLLSISIASPDEVWAAGHFDTGLRYETLTEFYTTRR